MDPQANLTEQIKLAMAIIVALEDVDDGEQDAIHYDAARLAELVLALNDWQARGGFAPKPVG